MLGPEDSRICSDCGLEKPLSKFSPRGRGYFASYCKPCNSNRTKAYNKTHKDRIKANDRMFRERNPDRVSEYNKRAGARWRAKNPDYYRRRHSEDRERRNAEGRQRYAQNREARKQLNYVGTIRRRESAARKLADRIDRLLPGGIPRDVRDEAKQSLLLAVLTGELSPQFIEKSVRDHINQAWPSRCGVLSIDAPINESSDLTLGEMLSDSRATAVSSAIRPRGRPRIDLDFARIDDLRRRGLNMGEIARDLGVNRNTLRRKLAERLNVLIEKDAIHDSDGKDGEFPLGCQTH